MLLWILRDPVNSFISHQYSLRRLMHVVYRRVINMYSTTLSNRVDAKVAGLMLALWLSCPNTPHLFSINMFKKCFSQSGITQNF